MIELLFIFILINFIYALRCYYVYINPASSFIFGLLGAVSVSLFYKEEWGLDKFHFNTFIVVVLGVFVFNFVSRWVYNKNKKYIINAKTLPPLKTNVNKWILLLVVFFILTITIWEYKAKISLTGSTNIGEALFELDYEYKNGDSELYQLPMILRNLILLRTCICLYFFYVFSKMLALKEFGIKFIMIGGVCALGLIGGLFSGSRGNILTFVLFSFFVWIIFMVRYYPKFKDLTTKKIISLSILLLSTITIFVKSTEWVGRSLYDWDPSYYIAIYCGAEIKNLDTYLNEKQDESKYFGEYTFSGISPKDDSSRDRQLEHVQFRRYQDYFLGNVYTAFQNYYQDFGILGVVLLVGIMAYIMQKLFILSLSSTQIYNSFFDFTLFLYAYLSTTVVFSFFSEKFYGAFSWYTLKLFIEVYVFSKMMNKLLYKKTYEKEKIDNCYSHLQHGGVFKEMS